MRVVNPHNDPLADAAFRQKAEPPERHQLLQHLRDTYGDREVMDQELVNTCPLGIQKGWPLLIQLICAKEVLHRKDGYGHIWVRLNLAQNDT